MWNDLMNLQETVKEQKVYSLHIQTNQGRYYSHDVTLLDSHWGVL